jgi:hydrogenase nickel incorporation protein HypA/HybF
VHELSIAMRIIETVGEELALTDDARVASVTVRVGLMSGVVPEALTFAWGAASEGTAFGGSRLDLEVVRPLAWCDTCGTEREPAAINDLRCPACRIAMSRVLRGKELEVLSVEVSDEDADGGSSDAGAEAERRARSGAA